MRIAHRHAPLWTAQDEQQEQLQDNTRDVSSDVELPINAASSSQRAQAAPEYPSHAIAAANAVTTEMQAAGLSLRLLDKQKRQELIRPVSSKTMEKATLKEAALKYTVKMLKKALRTAKKGFLIAMKEASLKAVRRATRKAMRTSCRFRSVKRVLDPFQRQIRTQRLFKLGSQTLQEDTVPSLRKTGPASCQPSRLLVQRSMHRKQMDLARKSRQICLLSDGAGKSKSR